MSAADTAPAGEGARDPSDLREQLARSLARGIGEAWAWDDTIYAKPSLREKADKVRSRHLAWADEELLPLVAADRQRAETAEYQVKVLCERLEHAANAAAIAQVKADTADACADDAWAEVERARAERERAVAEVVEPIRALLDQRQMTSRDYVRLVLDLADALPAQPADQEES